MPFFHIDNAVHEFPVKIPPIPLPSKYSTLSIDSKEPIVYYVGASIIIMDAGLNPAPISIDGDCL